MWYLQMMEVKVLSPKLCFGYFFSSCLDKYTPAIKRCVSNQKASRLTQVKSEFTH